MATTTPARKVTFRATSPFTGSEFTRKSARAYTHAVIYQTDAQVIADSYLAGANQAEADAARYAEIADHLRAGTTPQAGSVLLKPCHGWSVLAQRAGVKTEWDNVMFSKNHGPFPELTTADRYDGHAEASRARVASCRQRAADILADGKGEERATFHHSAALAAKAALAETGHSRTAIVAAAAPTTGA